MFQSAQTDLLVRQNLPALEELVALEILLRERFHALDAPVRCLVLAVASGEPMLLLGRPGTAKSMLIRSFADFIGISGPNPEDGQTGQYFDYLLTQFTEPSELFGHLNLADLARGADTVRRMDQGMMQNAQVVFLDEVFNASSAILNALLTFMNERKYHDRGQVLDVKMQNLFAASNRPPREPELEAMYDRFILRAEVHQAHATAEELSSLVAIGWTTSFEKMQADPTSLGLLDRMKTLQASIGRAVRSGQLGIDRSSRAFSALAYLARQARVSEVSRMSNRRLIKFARLFLLNRMIAVAGGASSTEIAAEDLEILIDYGLDRDDSGVREMMRRELHEML